MRTEEKHSSNRLQGLPAGDHTLTTAAPRLAETDCFCLNAVLLLRSQTCGGAVCTQKLTLVRLVSSSLRYSPPTPGPPSASVCSAHLAVQLVHVQDVFPTDTHRCGPACISFLEPVGYDAWPDHSMMQVIATCPRPCRRSQVWQLGGKPL